MPPTDFNIRIISAGAGSGKTYRLTQEMVRLLKTGVRPSGVIATTFTRKAAAELQERVRVKLLEDGLTREAEAITNALIGTVHGLGVKLLQRFAFESGVSPEVAVIADEDQQVLFNQALSTVLTAERVTAMDRLADRMGLTKRDFYDWRREVKTLTDIARANDFSTEVLQKSKAKSFESFDAFLDEPSGQTAETFNRQLAGRLETTVNRLENNEDHTKKTQSAVDTLKEMARELRLRGELYWHQWAKLGKLDTGAKSRDDVADLIEFARRHETHPQFRQDIREYIDRLFDIAIAAIQEYDQYKKRRGLIDYTDMEVLIKRLLDDERVKTVLADELDLLLVDEFQDTSPIQLEIFLRLSRLARHSIWVGDPKQSIYGFRGAEPRLMRAVIEGVGGVRPEDIQDRSWRSRQDLVYAANAIFTRAFPDLPAEQVALDPVRTRATEPPGLASSLHHWHFVFEGGRRRPASPWTENCIAEQLKDWLDQSPMVLPKDEKIPRPARPGDVAILCRSNKGCQIMAEALARAGFKVATARSGLLATTEAKLVLACLKYMLNQHDSLSVAEILLLAEGRTLEEIVDDRLAYLARKEAGQTHGRRWGEDCRFIRRLNELRDEVVELSSAELLNLLLSEMDLPRLVAGWGNNQQRLDNIDVIRRLARQYEEACNRLHSAASLGGFLLWLNELENEQQDAQGLGRGAEAVEVITYHKSKGLEWPVVICHHLENRLRADVWGAELIAESDTVDLDDVLGQRWLRYWVNPYADQYRNTPLEEKINASPAQADKTRQALREEARLLYVGVTRARDYLIFPTTTKPSVWLNRVWNQGEADQPTLDPHSHESPWAWNDQFLDIDTVFRPFPQDFTYAEKPAETIRYLAPPPGRQPYPPYRYDLRKESLGETVTARAVQTLPYGDGLSPDQEADTYPIAKLLKAFLTADWPDYPQAERLAIAQGLIDRHELAEWVEAQDLLRAGDQWSNFLAAQFNPQTSYRKYPVDFFRNGRRFETTIDRILLTDQGAVILQNSSFAGDRKAAARKATKELGDWLYLSRLAVQEIFQIAHCTTWVHFVLSGTLVQVETAEQLTLLPE